MREMKRFVKTVPDYDTTCESLGGKKSASHADTYIDSTSYSNDSTYDSDFGEVSDDCVTFGNLSTKETYIDDDHTCTSYDTEVMEKKNISKQKGKNYRSERASIASNAEKTYRYRQPSRFKHNSRHSRSAVSSTTSESRDDLLCAQNDLLHDSEILFAQSMLTNLKEKLAIHTLIASRETASPKPLYRNKIKAINEAEEFIDDSHLRDRDIAPEHNSMMSGLVPRQCDVIFDHIHRGRTHAGNKNLMALVKHRVPSVEYFQKMPIDMRRSIRNSVMTAIKNMTEDVKFMSWDDSRACWMELETCDVEARIFLLLAGKESAGYDVDYKEHFLAFNAKKSDDVGSTMELNVCTTCTAAGVSLGSLDK